MANFLLATPTISDAGSLTGSEAAGDMTIGNLLKRSLKRKYRTTSISAGEINIDLGSAQTIDLVALIAHNATAAGTVTVKAGSTDAVSDYTSGSLSLITGTDVGHAKNTFLLYLSTAQTYRYWKLEFADAANADGYIEAGRLYLANAFQPVTNMDYGIGEGFVDKSRVSRTMSGEPVPVNRDPYRFVEFTMSFGTKTEMFNTLYDIDRLRGISRDILFVQDPADTDQLQRRLIYGLMVELSPIINATFQIFQKKYKIEEIPA